MLHCADGQGSDPQLSGDATPALLVQYQSLRGLTDTQAQVLEEYFLRYYREGFSHFITTAPNEPVNLQPLRAFLIMCALSMPVDAFRAFFNHFYPIVPEFDATHKQNVYFRDLLLNFNRLCLERVDINQPLYANIFDPRLSPNKHLDSPTKKKLATSYFRKHVDCLLQGLGLPADNVMADNYVITARLSFSSAPSQGPTASSARKKLTFE